MYRIIKTSTHHREILPGSFETFDAAIMAACRDADTTLAGVQASSQYHDQRLTIIAGDKRFSYEIELA